MIANHNKRNHILCKRCGRRSMHISRKTCSNCRFGKSRRMMKRKV